MLLQKRPGKSGLTGTCCQSAFQVIDHRHLSSIQHVLPQHAPGHQPGLPWHVNQLRYKIFAKHVLFPALWETCFAIPLEHLCLYGESKLLASINRPAFFKKMSKAQDGLADTTGHRYTFFQSTCDIFQPCHAICPQRLLLVALFQANWQGNGCICSWIQQNNEHLLTTIIHLINHGWYVLCYETHLQRHQWRHAKRWYHHWHVKDLNCVGRNQFIVLASSPVSKILATRCWVAWEGLLGWDTGWECETFDMRPVDDAGETPAPQILIHHL